MLALSAMSPEREAQMFTRLKADYDFQQWLKLQEAAEIKNLVMQVDAVRLHRIQGRVEILQKLLT